MGNPFRMLKKVAEGRWERVAVNPDTKQTTHTGEYFRPLREDEDPSGREVVTGVSADGSPVPKVVKE